MMKRNLAKFFIGTLTIISLIVPSVMVRANSIVTTTYSQEVLVPDLSLPSFSQLKLLRLNVLFKDKEITSTYSNWANDRPERDQLLKIQCLKSDRSASIDIKLVNRDDSSTIKQTTIQGVGYGCNINIKAGTLYDLYVKWGTSAGKVTLLFEY